MSAEIKLPPFPRLSPSQAAVIASKSRFNVVSGGEGCGKSLLAVDVLLTHPRGALAGFPVVFASSNQEAIYEAKRRIMWLAEPLVAVRRRADEIRFNTTRGLIRFLDLNEERPEFFSQVSLVVVDDAAGVERLPALWEHILRPALSRYRGQAWIFSKPRGASNGFGQLYRAALQDADWSVFNLATSDNPTADLDAFIRESEEMEPLAFLQERLGQVLDQPVELTRSQQIIGPDESFLDWCDRLEAEGVKVDGHPFTLNNRPALRWVYSLIPNSPREAFGRILVMMKCAQVGFTVLEMLACIYMALKWMPCKIGMYLPSSKLAEVKSSERFVPIVRTMPDVHGLMVDTARAAGKAGEGNVLVRNLGESSFFFAWTTGQVMTESIPLDVLSFDEVQEMRLADMEKTVERLSASRIRFVIMGSTANWPDADIHAWYKRGTRHRFHTECSGCGEFQVLDEHFPACIGYDEAAHEYRYRCHACGGWLDDPQRGEWRPEDPEAAIVSIHFPQFLSPTISPREIIESYHNAEDLKNFYNRKLGKPYTDPSQVPVTLQMLNECAALGMEMGVVWKDRARETYMGIDQMGAYNVVLVAERLATGHMALIHAEEIYSDDPFSRCDALMEQYGVIVCVLEQLPNFNDAHRFAKRHEGRVFLVNYAQMGDDWIRWGDAVPSKLERRTDEDERIRYTVTIDQYRAMDIAFSRIKRRACVFPDPDGLVQEIIEKGVRKTLAVLRERVFVHFTKTALVAEKDEEQKKFRRAVKKIGLDPHFAYAFMLLSTAWSRAHGTSHFLFPDSAGSAVKDEASESLPGIPEPILAVLERNELPLGDVCANCTAFEDGACLERGVRVRPADPGCLLFVEK